MPPTYRSPRACRFALLRFSVLTAVIIAGGGALGPAACAQAGGDRGGEESDPSYCRSRANPTACQDTLRALVVFVRFQDDRTSSADWPDADAAGNPIPWTRLPPFAQDIVAATPEEVSRLTPQDSSLSAFFYWQSRHDPRGPHVFYGDVWPRNAQGEPEVWVTDRPNAAYHNAGPDGARQASGYGYLVREILDSLVTSPGFDVGHYDRNGDGVLDHLLLAVKRDVTASTEGIADLTGAGAYRGRPRGALKYWSPSRRDSVAVDWGRSGSISILGNWAARELLAHEYGHDYFAMGHTLMISPPHNDVPLDVPEENKRGRHACAYSRMCGVPYNYDDTKTLAAFELRRAGWAIPTVIEPAHGDREGVALGPLYTTAEVALIPLGDGAPADTLSLENRQRNNFFDAYPPLRIPDPNYGTVWRDLAATGLLATLTKGAPDGTAGPYRYDILPPDNQFAYESRCSSTTNPNCFPHDYYADDMYRPDGATQLTPWTRPNVSGYTLYPDGFEPNWFAVTNVRYDADGETMLFDFDADVRDGLTISKDSWMGEETSGETFTGEIRVADGATLTAEAGVVLTFEEDLVVEEGAALVVREGAVLRFAPGHRLDVHGTLTDEGGTFTARDAGQGWGGLHIH